MSASAHDDQTKNPASLALDRRVAEEIARSLSGLRFGSVEITVHDGKITQIETTKKVRLT